MPPKNNGYFSFRLFPCKLLFSLLIVCTLTGFSSFLLAAEISGTVTLPSGHTAPSGGVTIQIKYNSTNAGFGYKPVTIQENDSSATYTIDIPDDPNAEWLVSYTYPGGEEYIFHTGYYASTGTTCNGSAATLLSGESSYQDTNITLLGANTIHGTVSLPSGQTGAPTDIIVYVTDTNHESCNGSSLVTIPTGSSSSPYAVQIPDDPAASWLISYFYSYNNTNVQQSGYYASSGTTWNVDDATLLPGGQDYTIDALLTGNTIRGTITLPSGQTAPIGGIRITIFVINSNNDSDHYSSLVTIPEGSSSFDYYIQVPPDSTATWKVGYHVYRKSLLDGYYALERTVKNYSLATPLSAAQDHNGINITILHPFPWVMFMAAISGH